MRFTIVGAGAVGSLWALKLHEAGHSVQFWTRQSTDTLIRHQEGSPQKVFTANSLELVQESDCLLFCVKAFQVKEALSSIAAHVHKDTPVVFLHNGMGTAELALSTLPNNPLLLATTSHGSLKVSEETIKHTGLGETRLGGINSTGNQCDFLAEVFQHALPPCYWERSIERALWKKLAINCMINPLTALLQAQNGVITDPQYRTQLDALSDEISLVMCAEGMATSAKEVFDSAIAVATATAENYSSMNRDVYYRRPSEIEAITGFLIHRASIHGIATPENTRLYHAIKELEQSYDHT
ncbi:2-dehydropantoate 2-reductase [Enterovibrio coralii]|uniref:2-dehydropantoate 2-reductase n=1 Tax=Enterovibrio coralii TaxID=294935 RepID=A0A135I2X6_9GAMM|nr:2-dehydropantoate 2-reductase [Enterovibrio coralii]KXF79800.1 hypothetical protein ATN88_12960 [Enterovibrio coralii]